MQSRAICFWGLTLALLAGGACISVGEDDTSSYGIGGSSHPLGSEAGYLSVHGYRSVQADARYQCSNEFFACLAMDGEGRTLPVESLCPSSYTPEGTWTFEYQLWKDPYCEEPMSEITCEKHEDEWLGSGHNTNNVKCYERPADKDFEVDIEPAPTTVFLIMDEDAIDAGGEYFDEYGQERIFSSRDVNDDIADEDQRRQLRFFDYHVGQVIYLFSGQVGDEGWFALKRVPRHWDMDWKVGLSRFLWNPLALADYLDEVPFVTPLRARGLAALKGRTICALVFDSDVSVNYDPLYGDLSGETLGLIAFDILDVEQLFGYSSGSLPKVKIRIRDADTICRKDLSLFRDAPEPWSSSVPYDIDPWCTDDEGYTFVIR